MFWITSKTLLRTFSLTFGWSLTTRETVEREATERGIPFADHLRHLTVHGLLHLLGYDHETDAQAAEMEGIETQILARLGIADPYGDRDEWLLRP